MQTNNRELENILKILLQMWWQCNHCMGLLLASGWVPGTSWVLHMCPSEFQGLNGYCICIFWNFKNQEFFRIFQQTTFMFNFNLNSYQKSIEP
jgi:hypothetical protein